MLFKEKLHEKLDENGRKQVKKKFKTTDLFCKYIHKYYYDKSIKPEYVDQLCRYIANDFATFEDTCHDESMGFMVVAASTKQAKEIQKWFEDNTTIPTALVLCGEEDNKNKQEYFRGKRDNTTGETIIKYKGVVVFDMLLTGFDAPRLKRLYLLRTVREHNLLQTLARVKKKIAHLENVLFAYIGHIENNLEAFRMQIEPLDEKTVRAICAALVEYRECYNELRMSHEDVSDIPIDRLNKARYEVSHRIDILVAEHLLESDNPEDEFMDFTNLIVEFLKSGEIDLEFAVSLNSITTPFIIFFNQF